MLNLNTISGWRGLFRLPVKLFLNQKDENSYNMRNGGSGDFTLQMNEVEKNPEFYFSSAWSSNTKYFVSVQDKIIKVYDWRKNKVEQIKIESVANNLEKFDVYLNKGSYRSEYDR